jgi:hypothetical protein
MNPTERRRSLARPVGRIDMSMFVEAAQTVLLADFVSGTVHWAEDAYARSDTPIVGRWIGVANIEHHAKPRAFTKRTWLSSSWDLALAAVGVVTVAAWYHMLDWRVWLFAIVVANANQIHKWAHQSAHENGPIVTFLQKLRILQTQRHHARHHGGNKDSYYCSVTNFLNPILEEFNFWKTVEKVLARTLHLHRKVDPTVASAPKR